MAGKAIAVNGRAMRPWFDYLWNLLGALFLGRPSAEKLFLVEEVSRVERNNGTIVAPTSVLQASARPETKLGRARVVDLVLPHQFLLKRTVRAPKAARAKLREIAHLDLLRRTPFGMEDVYTSLSKATGGDGVLKATQWILKKTDLVSFIERLEQNRLQIRRVLVEDEGMQLVLIDRTEDLAPSGRLWRRANLSLFLLAAVLSVIAWGYPAWHAQAAIQDLNTQLDQRRSEVYELRKSVESKAASAGKEEGFVKSVLRRPRLAEVLRSLTVSLPDEAWLSELTVGGGRLTIVGETSNSATDLLIDLSKDSRFRDARFSGPVTRTSAGSERFRIALKTGQGG